jgi:hypothetical protein
MRRRLIAASVALFIALFGGIGIQLASGHDPALKSSSAARTTTQPTATSSQPTSQTTLDPVTTSQS